MTNTSNERKAMTREDLTAWLLIRGVREEDLAAEVDGHAGKTEVEMDELYEAQHGSMA